MKFHTDERLITTLIGESLYKSVDATVRELLQNAEDACAAAKFIAGSAPYVPLIVIRYSQSGGWFEVRDNGIGMTEEVLEKSFAAIGASKANLPESERCADPSDRQIGYFGIGILSCFGVAEKIQIQTSRAQYAPIAYSIPGPRDDFISIEPDLESPGTCVRLQIKADSGMAPSHVPAAVQKYVRHAEHIFIEDVDSGIRTNAKEQWNGVERSSTTAVEDPAIISGFLGLSSGWDNINQSLDCELVLCNGGFMVTAPEHELLPNGAFGYIGELDARPGALAIHMNRESFSHDQSWTDLGSRLAAHFAKLVREKLEAWQEELETRIPGEHICRALVILARDPAQQLIDEKTRQLAQDMLAKALTVRDFLSDREKPVASWIAESLSDRSIVLVREGDENRQVQESVSMGGRAVSLTDSVSTARIRAQHLALKGHLVLLARNRTFRASFGKTVQKVSIQDADVIQRAASDAKIRLQWLSDIADKDAGFSGSSYDRLIGSLFGSGGQMKFVSIPGADPVIRDYAGRLVNLASEDIQEILKFLPDAVGNPVRRELLSAYLDLRNYRYYSAQQRVRALLVDPKLDEKLTYTTGAYTREYVRSILEAKADDSKEDAK
jgi:hypothetical protein